MKWCVMKHSLHAKSDEHNLQNLHHISSSDMIILKNIVLFYNDITLQYISLELIHPAEKW